MYLTSGTLIERGDALPPNFRSQRLPGNETDSISSEEDNFDRSGDVVTSFSHLENLIFTALLLENQAKKSPVQLLPSTDGLNNVVTAPEPLKKRRVHLF